MNKDNFLTKFFKRLLAGMPFSQPQQAAQPETATLEKLFEMMESTDEVEIACDDVFKLLDHYVELEASGEDAASLWPLVKKHLDRCRDCHEEYEALLLVVQSSPGLTG